MNIGLSEAERSERKRTVLAAVAAQNAAGALEGVEVEVHVSVNGLTTVRASRKLEATRTAEKGAVAESP